MKNSTYLITTILTLLLFSVACKKEETPSIPPISQEDLNQCVTEVEWDSLKTQEALIGTWEWEYIDCFLSLYDDDNTGLYEDLTIEFKTDNTLEVIEDGEVTQTSNWEIVSYFDLYEIAADPPVGVLDGRILLCEDQVMFNGLFEDGCNNYYQRKE